MRKRLIVLLAALCLALSVSSCGRSTPASNLSTGLSSDIVRTDAHEEITWDFITLVEHDSELKGLLEKAIQQAMEENPDTDTNPVVSLESYYQFIDRIVRATLMRSLRTGRALMISSPGN